ncbi:MAG: TonB-dependent receptor plug domain-containing protein [Saprospiraceae bacterium]|nr:TonB-dependent receptor plug domain-containing protein [Saprospiraceae bacterium]
MYRSLKVWIFFLLLFGIAFGSTGQSILQKSVSLDLIDQPISTIIQSFSQQNEIDITFSNQIFGSDFNRSIQVENIPLGEALLEILKGTNTNFKVLGDNIVLIKSIPEQIIIKGYIKDISSGESLIGANIFEPHLSIGTNTNFYGFFSLQVPVGFRHLRFNYFGEGTHHPVQEFLQDTTLLIELETAKTLSEIIVEPTEVFPDFRLEEIGKERITNERVAGLPSLGGESDLFRTAFLLPGVQSGGDGLGGMYVRGGNTDQNLILLDGVPVYNAAHLVGIFSIFNPEAIRSSELMKGGISAKYGGRLSSIFDVRTREGNERKFSVNGGVGLISAKLSIEGPIQRDSSAYFLSFRRSLLDVYMRPITQFLNERNNVDGQTLYNYQDLNAKLNFNLSLRDRIFFSLYFGGDEFDDDQSRIGVFSEGTFIEKARNDLSWGNLISSFRWNHIYGEKLFSNTTLAFSQYNLDSKAFLGYDEIGSDTINISEFDYNQFRTNIKDFSIRQDFDLYSRPGLIFHFGAHFTRHQFDPAILLVDEGNLDGLTFDNILAQDPLEDISQPVNASNLVGYGEADMQLGANLKGQFGLRSSVFTSGDKGYVSLEPRVALTYSFSEFQALKFGLDVHQQPLHLLQRTSIGLPSDLWVPSTGRITPSKSYQASLGWTLHKKDGPLLGVETYFKYMRDLVTYQEGANFASINGTNWINQVTTGNGISYGVETWYEKNLSNGKLIFNYTFAYSTREFEEIANGRSYPFRYDRRHFLKTIYTFNLSDKWTLTSSWVLGSGNGVTLPTSVFDLPSNEQIGIIPQNRILDFTTRNGFRMPGYHRLDLSLIWTESKPGWEHRVELGAFNVYNRRNPLYISLREDPDDPDTPETVQVSLLPLVPSLNYTFRW